MSRSADEPWTQTGGLRPTSDVRLASCLREGGGALLPAFLLLLAAGVVSAQPVGDVITAEVEVRVVNVEVFVEDRDGMPVTGLTREDF